MQTTERVFFLFI